MMQLNQLSGAVVAFVSLFVWFQNGDAWNILGLNEDHRLSEDGHVSEAWKTGLEIIEKARSQLHKELNPIKPEPLKPLKINPDWYPAFEKSTSQKEPGLKPTHFGTFQQYTTARGITPSDMVTMCVEKLKGCYGIVESDYDLAERVKTIPKTDYYKIGASDAVNSREFVKFSGAGNGSGAYCSVFSAYDPKSKDKVVFKKERSSEVVPSVNIEANFLHYLKTCGGFPQFHEFVSLREVQGGKWELTPEPFDEITGILADTGANVKDHKGKEANETKREPEPSSDVEGSSTQEEWTEELENKLWSLIEYDLDNGGTSVKESNPAQDKVQKEFAVIMEMFGPNLHELASLCKSLPILDLINLAHELIPLLEFLHSLGILHRDIKPANFVISTNARHFAVIDLAWALLMDKTNRSKVLYGRVDRCVGTQDFTSGPALDPNHVYTPWDDVASLLTVLAYLENRELPWDLKEDTMKEELKKKVKEMLAKVLIKTKLDWSKNDNERSKWLRDARLQARAEIIQGLKIAGYVAYQTGTYCNNQSDQDDRKSSLEECNNFYKVIGDLLVEVEANSRKEDWIWMERKDYSEILESLRKCVPKETVVENSGPVGSQESYEYSWNKIVKPLFANEPVVTQISAGCSEELGEGNSSWIVSIVVSTEETLQDSTDLANLVEEQEVARK